MFVSLKEGVNGIHRIYPIGSMGLVYLPIYLYLVDFYGKSGFAMSSLETTLKKMWRNPESPRV